MSENDSLEPLRRWLAEKHKSIDIAGQITTRATSTAQGTRTKVSIDHLLACELPGFDGWRITTKPTYLPLAHFSSWAAHQLKTASRQRGRTIACMDHSRDDEVVAAISYHIDDRSSWPVFITMVGLRIDLEGDADLRRRTIVGAYLVKQYVHAIAGALGRPGEVHIDLSPASAEVYASELGFRKAKRLRGLKVAGVHMSQAPLI